MSQGARLAMVAVIQLLVCLTLACRKPRTTPTPPDAPRGSVRPVPVEELCVSSGALRAAEATRWINEGPALRATVAHSAGHHAALSFRYLGGTEQKKLLGSGRERQQIGLKLLSRDTCNVVYAMWRLGERSSVVASIKSNPEASRHQECGNRGYRNLRPYWRAPVDSPAVGSTHELSASVSNGLLELRIDAKPVLRAVLSGRHDLAVGSSGLRSDNVRFELLRFDADVLDARGPTRSSCR